MPDYTKQHFVPKCYLKAWATDREIYWIPKKGGQPKKRSIESAAFENNLYTLPNISGTPWSPNANPMLTSLLLEGLFSITESRWRALIDYLVANRGNEGIGDIEVSNNLGFFVANQSFRTPKFLREEREIAKDLWNKASVEVTDSLLFGHLLLSISEYLDYYTIELLCCGDNVNFITSDNPATHWIQDPNNNYTFYYAEKVGIFYKKNWTHNNPYYRILCPLHPKVFLIMSPHLRMKLPVMLMHFIPITNISDDAVIQVNQMIKTGADRMLFASRPEDLLNL